MTFKDAGRRLMTLAEEFECAQVDACRAIEGDCDIDQALRTIRGVVTADDYISVAVDVKQFRDGEAVKVQWTCYDGHAHFRGETLTAAVNAVLAAHAPAPEDALANAQASLSPLPM